jgi:dephospho-CoA kinase
MLRVGLTGGLATGKTFVGQALVDLGAHLLQADQIGHEVLLPGGEAYDGVIAEFGPGILAPDRTIDRRRLGALVFGQPEKLARLNALVHPPVIAREERWLAGIVARDPAAIAIVEAAILIETGSYKRFHRLILTVCPLELQIERAMKRDQLSREEILDRLRRQMPLEQKKEFAHFVIDTSGEKEQTLEKVRTLYQELQSIHL